MKEKRNKKGKKKIEGRKVLFSSYVFSICKFFIVLVIL